MTALLDRPTQKKTESSLSPELLVVNRNLLSALKVIEDTDIKNQTEIQNNFANLRYLISQLSSNSDSNKLANNTEFSTIRKFLRENVNEFYRITFIHAGFQKLLNHLYELYGLQDVLNRSSVKLEDTNDFPLIGSETKIPKTGLIKNSFIVQRSQDSNEYLKYSDYKKIEEILKEERIKFKNNKKHGFDDLIWDYAKMHGFVQIYPTTKTSLRHEELSFNDREAASHVNPRSSVKPIPIPREPKSKSLIENLKSWFTKKL